MSDANNNNNTRPSRVALYHAAVDGVKTALDLSTSHYHHYFKDAVIDGMRKMLPRDATEAEFENVRALATTTTVTNENSGGLLLLPFEAALEAKCERGARVLLLLKYTNLLQAQSSRPFVNDRASFPSVDVSPSSTNMENVD